MIGFTPSVIDIKRYQGLCDRLLEWDGVPTLAKIAEAVRSIDLKYEISEESSAWQRRAWCGAEASSVRELWKKARAHRRRSQASPSKVSVTEADEEDPDTEW